MIDMYLTNKSELDDRAVHLLFSANRWEARYVSIGRFLSSYRSTATPYFTLLQVVGMSSATDMRFPGSLTLWPR